MKNLKINVISIISSIFILSSIMEAKACTKFVYTGNEDIVLTGRTADWAGKLDTNLWLFPRGIERNGLAGKKSVKWTSKYGSIAASVHNMMTIDGVNEKGLTMAILRLKESEFIPQKEAGNRKALGISLWGQYFLDNFATVEEAVEAMKEDKIYVVPLTVADGESSGMHLAISDSKGDFAVFEYTGKKLHIYHNKNFKVATNSPKYLDQMAIDNYWNSINGKNFLPGTSKSSDRFVRAFYYLNKLPKTSNIDLATTYVLSLIRNVSSPLGIENGIPNQEESATLWRTITNHKDMTYFFESAYKSYGFTVDLTKVNFDKDQKIQVIDMEDGKYYFGDATNKFTEAKSFNFFPSDGKIVEVK